MCRYRNIYIYISITNQTASSYSCLTYFRAWSLLTGTELGTGTKVFSKPTMRKTRPLLKIGPGVAMSCLLLVACCLLFLLSGWWFGTFFIFPYIGNNHPNWLIFFRGVQTTNQLLLFVCLFGWLVGWLLVCLLLVGLIIPWVLWVIQLLSWAVALYHLGPVGLIRFIPSCVFKGSLYPKSVCWCCWNSTFRPAHWTTLLGSWENPARFACIQLFAAPRIWHVVLVIVSALDVYMLIPFSRIH